MDKKYTYISVLSTDDYLPGLLVLNKSLQNVNSMFPLHVLLTGNISKKTISILDKKNISYSITTEKISNPTNVNKKHRWFPTYSKLLVFKQIKYEKIVYLDVDMLVLRNIDDLFLKPHMSATNAGGLLPRKISWTHMNTGLFIFKPSIELFNNMKEKIGKIEPIEVGGTEDKPKFGSDQDFLNAYYPNWSKQKDLHLDHKYNIFHYYVDEYRELFGYSIENGKNPIFVLHFASYLKPWNMDEESLEELFSDNHRPLEASAIKLWLDVYSQTI